MNSEKLLFVLKILAVFLIPSMYTITYLAANEDPYGNMDQVPVAIINNDEGFEYSGVNVNVGTQIAAGLVESNGFDFSIISEEDFSYDEYFMKLTIPSNMSESILNPVDSDYEQVKITMNIDESKNYIFSSIAGESLFQMESEINNNIQEQYLSVGINIIQEAIGVYNDKNTQISDMVYELNDQINSSQDDINNIMASVNSDINNVSSDVSTIQSELDDVLSEVDTNKENILSQIDDIETSINTKIDELNSDISSSDLDEDLTSNIIDNISTNSNQILDDVSSSITQNYDNIYDEVTGLKDDLDNKTDSTISTIDDRISEINNTIGTAETNIDSLQADVLSNDNLYNQLSLDGNITSMINFFATPIYFESDRENAVDTYGQGLAPYFVSLSLYVGALILLTVLPYEEVKKSLYKFNHFKRLVFYYSFSIFQVFILFFLLKVINDFNFLNPYIFITYSIFISLFFISIILLLVLILKDIGKFIAFILLVLQLGGSAGTFPIETAPRFFQIINPFLPMTYTINKYREILFLEDVSISKSIIVLSVCIIASFIILLRYLNRVQPEKKMNLRKIVMDK